MGAIPYDGGVTFRVWAPNADTVSVAGQFNGWSSSSNLLSPEDGGMWSADVAAAEAGDQYKYVIKTDGDTMWRTDPRAGAVVNSVGNGIIVDQDSFNWTADFTMPSWNETIIYEMHVGTFYSPTGGTPSSWYYATQKLDHLADLGINMIEVMPINEFAGDHSWGYNPAHLFAPESAYGSVHDMKNFINEAHKRGIGVMIDVVYNHWGPSDLDTAYWCFDGPCYDNGGIYFYDDWRAVTEWGDTRPNYGRSEVRDFISDNAYFWLNEFNADGLRWDSTSNIRTQNSGGGGDIGDGWWTMQIANDRIDGTWPEKLIIAEDMLNNEWLTKTTGAGGAGFDSQWDSSFVHTIRNVIITGSDSNRNMWDVYDMLVHGYNNEPFQRVIYTESHDEVANGKARVPEEIWPGNSDSWFSRKRSTAGAALLFTAPGIPMIFQGQEFLEDGWFHDDDPLDWSKRTTQSGIYALYRDLVHLRRNIDGTTRGLTGEGLNIHHVNDGAKVIAYHRWMNGGEGDDVVVVINFSATSFTEYRVGFPRAGAWHARFNSDDSDYGADFTNLGNTFVETEDIDRDGMGQSAKFTLRPYTAIIFSQGGDVVAPADVDVVDAILGKRTVPDNYDANQDRTLDIADVN
ncbi:alpha amylase C-terminal domain-containing protein [bacterium]|nr:alpha amylase C-terminal domain-containing protein [bacterium]